MPFLIQHLNFSGSISHGINLWLFFMWGAPTISDTPEGNALKCSKLAHMGN